MESLDIDMGPPRIKGAVTNTGDQPVTRWSVTVNLNDAKEEPVETKSTYSSTRLDPKQAQEFEIVLRGALDPRIVGVTARIESVALGDSPR